MATFHKAVPAVMVVILAALVSLSLFFYQRSHTEHITRLSDVIVREFREGLSEELAYLLSFSLALSENGALKEALRQEDESAGHRILNDITERFKRLTHLQTLRLQVLTPEFYIFSRSWDEGFEGMPIWWFRDDLETLRNNKQPKAGVETGRLLTFKSTIPIRSHKRLLGYLEVIRLMDEFSIRLREAGIELFVLMDEAHMEKASLMGNFPRLFGKVIVNQNFHDSLKQQLEAADIDRLKKEHHLEEREGLLLWEPMYNGSGDRIGAYLLVVSKEALARFEHETEHISILKPFSNDDMKRAVERREERFGSYRSGYDRDLVGLLAKLHDEDKREMEQEAREILSGYTKHELIDIILSNRHQEKKRGTIE